jgi:hypothetical protein
VTALEVSPDGEIQRVRRVARDHVIVACLFMVSTPAGTVVKP